MCDIEFTIEDGRLWMLQAGSASGARRPRVRIAVDMAEDPAFPLSRARGGRAGPRPLLAHPPTVATARSNLLLPLVTGLPASPGVASGPIATTPEAAAGRGRDRTGGDPRPRGDVARRRPRDGPGGRDPHLARRSRQPCRGRGPRLGDPGGRRRGRHGGPRRPSRRRGPVLEAGDVITIDGSSGEVFAGDDPGLDRGRAGGADAARVGRGARDPDRQRPRPDARPPSVVTCPPRSRLARSTPDDCLRAIAIKGFAPVGGVADAILSTPDVVQPILDQLAIDGLVATVAGAYRLTETGTTRADALLAAERDAWGPRRRPPRSTPSSTSTTG